MARGAANWARRDEMGGIEGRGAYTGHQRGGRRAIGRDSSGGWRGKDEDKMTLNRQFLSQRHPTQIFFGWVPFPSPTASSWAPLQQTASGVQLQGSLSAVWPPPEARDIPIEAPWCPSTPAKVGQDPTSDLEPTNSHHRHDERPSASPVSTSRSSASPPP